MGTRRRPPLELRKRGIQVATNGEHPGSSMEENILKVFPCQQSDAREGGNEWRHKWEKSVRSFGDHPNIKIMETTQSYKWTDSKLRRKLWVNLFSSPSIGTCGLQCKGRQLANTEYYRLNRLVIWLMLDISRGYGMYMQVGHSTTREGPKHLGGSFPSTLQQWPKRDNSPCILGSFCSDVPKCV